MGVGKGTKAVRHEGDGAARQGWAGRRVRRAGLRCAGFAPDFGAPDARPKRLIGRARCARVLSYYCLYLFIKELLEMGNIHPGF